MKRASANDGHRARRAGGELRIGISGWTYPPWRGGNFYPEKWPQKRELEYASRQVNSIEINGSFYSLQRPESYAAWHDATPEDFVFSVKGGRFITHLRRLRNVEEPLANFFASGVLRLREKLGPILWQLPPQLAYDRERLEGFFRLLPRTTSAAASLARHHDTRLDGRAWTHADEDRPLRHAIEVRHESFAAREFIELLRAHDIALVVADTAGKWPFMEDVTSDFVYVRLHGDEELYVSGYTEKALAIWEKKIRAWSTGETSANARLMAALPRDGKRARDVFVYFDNDVKVRSPFDAMTLAHRLGLNAAPGPPPDAKAIEIARLQARPISADRRWNFRRKISRSRQLPRKRIEQEIITAMPTKKKGLYANIAAKKKRIAKGSGEKMRKPGAKGAPKKGAFKKAAKTAKKK